MHKSAKVLETFVHFSKKGRSLSGSVTQKNHMEIRSITCFISSERQPENLSAFLNAARRAFSFAVQSTRLALPPFPNWWEPAQLTTNVIQSFAIELAQRCQSAGFDYISLGPVQLAHADDWLEVIPDLLSATSVLFTAVEIADAHGQISLLRCRQMARIIQQASRITNDGFGNLYLAALANCPPGSPFFPVAYSSGGSPTFALAVEGADLVRKAFQSANNLDDARANLITAVEIAAVEITAVADKLAAEYGIPCHGIDFSLAPYPTAAKSLAGGMEDLGLPHVGASGSLFAAAFITDALGKAKFRRCGFSGLMLPVLEDAVLADRAARGAVTLSDLLSYAAVCGVGLDTIPLPGDISEASLSAILLDVAALSVRLNKPLTARLMPLPGLKAGDLVSFDFPYFADSRVMPVVGDELSGSMAATAVTHLDAYH